MNRSVLVLGGVVACLGSAALARATPCGRADLVAAFPPDQAGGVPVDATLSAHYADAAQYLGEPVAFGTDGAPVSVQATFDASESMLSFTPSGPLRPNTKYEIDWPGLRGPNSTAVGSALDVHFTTGAGTDGGPPRFDGVTGIEFDVSHARDECTNSVEDRYRFTLHLADASDDGGRDALALLVFQTSGPNIPEGSPEPVSITPFPASSSITLDRAVPDAVGRVCFAAIARDLTGRISTSGDREVCTHTAAPPVFFGCSLAGSRARAGVDAWPFALLALGELVRRRRRAAPGGHAR